MAKAGISVYPNPIVDLLNLTFSNVKINQISINNLLGNTIYETKNPRANELKIDFKSIPKGLYILNLKTSKGDFSKKLFKE